MKKVWVLKYGRIYFREMTNIGPRGSTSRKDAARFTTREEAMRSPAYTFSLSCFQPREITIK